MIISLIGFMASGKTTLGEQLAASMKVPFVDLDALIEEKENRTVAQIFSERGEAEFRKLEERYLEELLEEHISQHPQTLEDLPPRNTDEEYEAGGGLPLRHCSLVLSVGGGCVMSPLCADLLERFTYCIYLEADPRTLFQRLSEASERGRRPLLQGGSLMEHIETLYRQREPYYRKLARKTIRC